MFTHTSFVEKIVEITSYSTNSTICRVLWKGQVRQLEKSGHFNIEKLDEKPNCEKGQIICKITLKS